LARAKHTDRSAARRRYRVEQTAQPDMTEDEASAETADETGARRPARPANPARPGIVMSLRTAFRPLDLRGDLLVAPTVLLNWAVLVAIVAAVASTAVFILSSNAVGASLDFSNPSVDPFAGKSLSTASNVSYLVVGFFVTPPPAAGAFLVGFFAKRASWLGGLAIGIVAGLCYTAVLISPAGRLLIKDITPDASLVISNLIGAVVGAVLFASAAAWYRRFLTIANPNRAQQQRGRQAAKPKPRPAAGRPATRR
jgi:hypothetical protein